MGQYQRRGSGGRQQQAAPKPFDFVPLPKRVTRKPPTGHQRYRKDHITGRICGTIEALSPIHIGSGIIDLAQNVKLTTQDVDLIKTAVRTGDKVTIPGSSLKGAIRSVVEAISESCVCKTNIEGRLLHQFSECDNNTNLCVACRMFGAMGFQGNIAIQDALHIDGQIVTKLVPSLYAPRRYQTDDQNNLPMRKFYMHGEVASGRTPVEACKEDSKFRFSVQIDNLKEAEWGLLFTALGHHPEYPFKLKIGGAKPACFGSVDFQIEEIHIQQQTQERYLDWDFQQDIVKKDNDLETWMDKCIAEATNSLIQMNLLKAVAEILQFHKNRNCPSRLY